MAAMGTAEIPPCPSAEAPAPPAGALAPPSGSRGAPRKRLRVDWATKLAAALPPEGSPAAGGAACASTAVAEPEDRAHGGVGGSYEPALVGLGDLATLAPALPRCCSVALATCMRGCPAARLREWLFWHLSHGVRPIFLRWEGPLSAAQSAELAGPRERGDVVLRVVPSVGHLSSGFNSVMARQVKFVHRCLAEARHLGCDFLLHLDDDELLCPIRGSLSIPDVLGLHCRSTARCIHFENWEAVMPFAEATSRPFSRTGVEFRTRLLYCNGKSAANLTAPGSVYCSGVHHFCRYDRTFSEICVARYGLHDKVSRVVVGEGALSEQLASVCDINILREHSVIHKISYLSEHVDPLAYLPIHVDGRLGYSCGLQNLPDPHTGQPRKTSMSEFCSFRLMQREPSNALEAEPQRAAGRLFHKFIVDAIMKVEHARLDWTARDQRQLRKVEAMQSTVIAIGSTMGPSYDGVSKQIEMRFGEWSKSIPLDLQGQRAELYSSTVKSPAMARRIEPCKPEWRLENVADNNGTVQILEIVPGRACQVGLGLDDDDMLIHCNARSCKRVARSEQEMLRRLPRDLPDVQELPRLCAALDDWKAKADTARALEFARMAEL
ncbi:unnamed protein product [Prorocentrum cordatum]|uniref:Glycosyltransferase family 92 protein n=1 Tax=Prorocentrum cordatum TaxID=2364126 RepID=A0ABN9TGG3_9DINO|nr:unnamed protein product [Polarella glacialis]